MDDDVGWFHPELRFAAAYKYNLEAPLTLTHPILTGMLVRTFQNRSAAFTRWLGLLLAVFILYGTTVEAAHRHGRVLPDSGAASLVNSDQTNSPLTSKTGCSDCLICQLHQHFNTTLIAVRLVAPPKQIRIKVPPAIAPDILSRVTGTIAGRAPPTIS